MIEDPSDRRIAGYIIDHIGDLGITVAAFRIGREAEGGWELQAVDHTTGEIWRIEADRVLDAVAELALVVGIDLAD